MTESNISSAPAISDEEMRLAAYALNLCTVSISQIIDYDDVNILEQEYDAILNNLNLENMPKDKKDALLDVYKNILDTITAFRISEGERAIVEKEYQHKVKNAIWNAVPSFGMIVAGGNLLTMAVSLASQVGIGYMNYRRDKAEIELEHEKNKWQIAKSAIEQFNGLRRCLFEAAWNLEEEYKFPDEYRLTEKQITAYNRILMDNDNYRKYERLASIQKSFEAYPPFWYFIGNAANAIACDPSNDENTRSKYREKALYYFEKFENIDQKSVLRENQLAASCALEHIDILLLDENFDREKVLYLLNRAVKLSGNEFDVLQLCAVTYLRIGEKNKASEILKKLVNEDYNKMINAQLLSSIYVYEGNKTDYRILSKRVSPEYLFPFPQGNQNVKMLETQFSEKQKEILSKKYESVLSNYVMKYSSDINKITSVFDPQDFYDESFFNDTQQAREQRRIEAQKFFSGSTENYLARICAEGYETQILDILNRFYSNLITLPCISSDKDMQKKVYDDIHANIASHKDDLNKLQASINSRTFGLNEYIDSQKFTISFFAERSLHEILKYAGKAINGLNLNNVGSIDSKLHTFCIKNGINEPLIITNSQEKENLSDMQNDNLFSAELLGHEAEISNKFSKYMSDMADFIKGKFTGMVAANNDTVPYFRGDDNFNGYFANAIFDQYPELKQNTAAVLQNTTSKRRDLLFTSEGLVYTHKMWKTPYEEVRINGNMLLIFRDKYQTTTYNINELYYLTQELGKKFIKSNFLYSQQFYATAEIKELNQWFLSQPYANDSDVLKVYAIPSAEALERIEKMGYYDFDNEFDKNSQLLQFMYNQKTNNIMCMRIVKYDKIETNFQFQLNEHKGIIVMK